MSYYLQQIGREHIVLERARVAESWRSERWDSLVFQFPSWSIKLPGHAYRDGNPDGFAPKDAVLRFIEDYAAAIRAPVRCGVNVHSLRQEDQSKRFVVDTGKGRLQAVNVVVATGSYHRPIVPAFSASMPAWLFQVHSRDYRNPRQLPHGDVLIVGSGASGVQIAEDLHQSGRHVYLSVGRHDKAPRRYLRNDIYWWLDTLEIWRRPLDLQPEMRTWRPVFTGVAGGHDIDLRQFAADGITLLGRLKGATIRNSSSHMISRTVLHRRMHGLVRSDHVWMFMPGRLVLGHPRIVEGSCGYLLRHRCWIKSTNWI